MYVKTGTQIIDRFWSHLRKHLRDRKKAVGSTVLRHRIRSAQWSYWYKEEDAWQKTGDMLSAMRKP